MNHKKKLAGALADAVLKAEKKSLRDEDKVPILFAWQEIVEIAKEIKQTGHAKRKRF